MGLNTVGDNNCNLNGPTECKDHFSLSYMYIAHTTNTYISLIQEKQFHCNNLLMYLYHHNFLLLRNDNKIPVSVTKR